MRVPPAVLCAIVFALIGVAHLKDYRHVGTWVVNNVPMFWLGKADTQRKIIGITWLVLAVATVVAGVVW